MGIGSWLGLGKDIAEPIKAVGDLYTTDKARIEAETKLEEVVQKPVIAQSEINKINAEDARWFNSGWRPLCGYVCTASLAWTYLFQPIFVFILSAAHGNIPILQNNTGDIMPIITGMLGLGILRSVEKIKRM
jgi:hypothetical protein